MLIPQMPLPIILPREALSTVRSLRILTPINKTIIYLRCSMNIVDVPMKIFGCPKPFRTIWALLRLIVIALMLARQGQSWYKRERRVDGWHTYTCTVPWTLCHSFLLHIELLSCSHEDLAFVIQRLRDCKPLDEWWHLHPYSDLVYCILGLASISASLRKTSRFSKLLLRLRAYLALT